MYLTFSWAAWSYGSSFGLRAMIQSYPMLSIALGCLVTVLFKKTYKVIISLVALLFFVWLNIFQTYQAHEGIININHMNDRYFVKIFGKPHISNKEYNFLDTDEGLDSSDIQSSREIYHKSFSPSDSSTVINPDTLQKNNYCLILNSKKTYLTIENNLNALQLKQGDWITVSFDAYIKNMSYTIWNMPFVKARVSFLNQVAKERSIRISNKIGNNDAYNFDQWGHAGIWDRITFDFKIPKNSKGTDSLYVLFSNPNETEVGGQDVYLNNIKVDCIKTK